MKTKEKIAALCVGFVVLSGLHTQASTLIYTQPWGTENDTLDWSLTGDGDLAWTAAHLDGPSAANTTPGALGVTGPATPGVYLADILGGDLIGANWAAQNVQGIYFDFYVDPSSPAPSSLEIYLDQGGQVWWWDVTPQISGDGWMTLGGNVMENSPPFGSWQTFGSNPWNISSIANVGLSLAYPNAIGPVYAIDNFTLTNQEFLVPEPETYAFIAMALLSLAFVYRKRLEDQFQLAMARVQTLRMG